MLAVILAGGSGSRLWPLSRELYPKQLLALAGEQSLLQATWARVAALVRPQGVVTLTNVRYCQEVRLQLQDLGESGTVIAEPLPRDTAPAIAAALRFLLSTQGDDLVLITPADHLIRDLPAFERSVQAGCAAAEQGRIVTFGIRPGYPETGYGYICAQGEAGEDGARAVERFVEKPDAQTAQRYLEEGNYYWNSGLFLSRISVLLGEYRAYAPVIHGLSAQLSFTPGAELEYGIYERMPAISIDYAIMEHSRLVSLVELQSDWNDLGSWQSIYQVRAKDEQGNVLIGRTLTQGVRNSLIYSQKELVAAAGVENLILVETEDAILACSMQQAQQVRQLYAQLRQLHPAATLAHKTISRPWGYYTTLNRGEGYLTKLLCVLPRHRLSYQSHAHRSEHWVVLSGEARIILEGREYRIYPGDSFDIPVLARHSLQNPAAEELRIIEVQRGAYLSEDDIIRYSDDYGRS